MRDARTLAWVLADPTRRSELSAVQREDLARLAEAEGLAEDLAQALSGFAAPFAPPAAALEAEICRAAVDLLKKGALERGVQRLWHINQMVQSGKARADFWDRLVQESRAQAATPAVSRALRLCRHLFEAEVDPFLAWQAQRSDIFFVGRLLARNGAGQETARVLRLAFRLRARWKAWRG